MRVELFRADWVIQRYVLREYGVALAGPPPHTLIDPVSQADICRAVRQLALESWAPLGDNPARLAQWHWGAHVYAILTMCRMLHTLESGAVISKAAAARWARSTLGPPWASLIDRALAWRKTDSQEAAPADTTATGALIQIVVERWRTTSC